MPPKTVCPISREDFLAKAHSLKVDLNGFPMQADPREFSTGSFGFYFNGKVSIMIDGKPIQCQCQVSMQVVGSKDLPRSNPPPAAS